MKSPHVSKLTVQFNNLQSEYWSVLLDFIDMSNLRGGGGLRRGESDRQEPDLLCTQQHKWGERFGSWASCIYLTREFQPAVSWAGSSLTPVRGTWGLIISHPTKDRKWRTLRIGPRSLHMLGRRSATDLCPQPSRCMLLLLVSSAYMSASHAIHPTAAKRGHQIRSNWSSRGLGASMWVLGREPSSGRAVTALSH